MPNPYSTTRKAKIHCRNSQTYERRRGYRNKEMWGITNIKSAALFLTLLFSFPLYLSSFLLRCFSCHPSVPSSLRPFSFPLSLCCFYPLRRPRLPSSSLLPFCRPIYWRRDGIKGTTPTTSAPSQLLPQHLPQSRSTRPRFLSRDPQAP